MRTMILDMDGTLFDTERVYHDAWLSVGVPEEMYFRMVGRSRQEIWKMIDCELQHGPAGIVWTLRTGKGPPSRGRHPRKNRCTGIARLFKAARLPHRFGNIESDRDGGASLTQCRAARIFRRGDWRGPGCAWKTFPGNLRKSGRCGWQRSARLLLRQRTALMVYGLHIVPAFTRSWCRIWRHRTTKCGKIADAIVPSLLEVPALLEARA